MATVALANRVKVSTATTGTGTVTLGAAFANNYLTFAEGGITDGQTVRYEINEGTDFEIGTGVYTAAGTTMTRASVTVSKISGTSGTSKMNLAGAATVSIVAVKEDFFYDGFASTTASFGVGTIELGHASDTTLSRASAGVVAVEGSNLVRAADVAAQSDQETGTSTTTFVSPGRQQYHPSAAKGWADIAGAGTSINASYNVTSITDTATGHVTVNWTTAFSSANYSAVGCSKVGAGVSSFVDLSTHSTTATSFRNVKFDASALNDPSFYNIVAFGDQ